MKAWELLNQLYFERVSGTDEETRAAHLIADALKDLGVEAVCEAFDVTRNQVQKESLEVLEPYQKTIEATAYMGCPDTDENGLELDLTYFESDTPVSRRKAEGKIALVNGYLGRKTYKALIEANAKAFISYNGNIDYPINDLDDRELRQPLQEIGNIPGVNILVNDAMELIEKKASKVRITTKQEVMPAHSHNVICELKGESDEWIVCTAHYDSVPNSKGVYDNATGAVCLYEMIKYFKDHPHKHNLRFIFCGSEERGLLGSKAYVEAHKEEMEKIKLNVNIDMIGSTMGRRIAVATSDISLVHFTDYFAKIKGFPMECSQGVYSSDSTPFADAGVPAVSFARITTSGTGVIHCRYDVIERLNEAMLLEDIAFIQDYVEEMANAYVIPVVREMPDNMKEELDKYLGRKD